MDYSDNYDDYLNKKDSLINVKLGDNTTVQDLLDIMANSGAFDFTGSISGKDTQDIADAFGTGDDASNIITQLISNTLNTQAKTILGEYTFAGSGAITINTDVSNGIWLSPTGILGKKGGNPTFTIGTDGTATFYGTLSAASGTLGAITIGSNAWHVDSSGNMWWGSSGTYAASTYKIGADGSANLSGIVASSVAAENITGTTITGKTVRTASSGTYCQLNGSTNQLEFYYSNAYAGFVAGWIFTGGAAMQMSTPDAESCITLGEGTASKIILYSPEVNIDGNLTIDGNYIEFNTVLTGSTPSIPIGGIGFWYDGANTFYTGRPSESWYGTFDLTEIT